MDFKSPDVKGHEVHASRSRRRTARAARSASRSARPSTRPTRRAQGASTWRRQPPLREQERKNCEFFLDIPEADRTKVKLDVKGTQFLEPLFEFSGACTGCGETPYLKLLTQLFGDRAIIANATGCSSIYGGNLPTTPYCVEQGRPRPGLGQLAVRGQRRVRLRHAARDRQAGRARAGAAREARHRRRRRARRRSCSRPTSPTEAGIAAQRARVKLAARRSSPSVDRPRRSWLASVADYLVKKSVWIVGGDGWAYDIGYGGLDHVIAHGPRREHPRARHRGVLEHRRPGVEGDADGRGREVRDGRQDACRRRTSRMIAMTLRPPVRRAGRVRREGRADGQRVPGGRQLPRARRSSSPTRTASRTATTCQRRARAAGARGRLRLLAALPLRPAPRGAGREPAQARLARRRRSTRRRVRRRTRPASARCSSEPGAVQGDPRAGGEDREGRYALYEQLSRAMTPDDRRRRTADGTPKARAPDRRLD